MSWSGQLPTELRQAIEDEASRIHPRDLAQAASELTASYRESGRARLATDAHRAAYAVVRMPATYAAIAAVIREARTSVPSIESALDIGAGPGTVAWALSGLKRLTLIESNPGFITLGRKLGTPGKWIELDLRDARELPPHDLVICAYSMGELDEATRVGVTRMAWRASIKALAVIEPGTPAGFARIRSIRDELIRGGATIAAPCPHDGACPMPSDDWCHFAQRVERSTRHRRMKAGTLGYEDEKFSYVIATRKARSSDEPRVLRHPHAHPGYIQLALCTKEGLAKATVTRSRKEQYSKARKLRWGDVWTLQEIVK